MHLRCFAPGLFALLLVAGCDKHEAASADSLAVDSATSRLRRVNRPALPVVSPTPALLAPDTVALRAPAPDSFDIVFETSQGNMTVAVKRAWAPRGVDRLHYLAKHGFFDAMRFYKVQRDYIAQFGLSGDPRVTAVWDTMTIADDSSSLPHVPGTLSFATRGPNTRTTQLFFSLSDNTGLEKSGLAVVGRIVAGREVLSRFYDVHGQGLGEDRIRKEGNAYLDRFTNLDYIVRATVKP